MLNFQFVHHIANKISHQKKNNCPLFIIAGLSSSVDTLMNYKNVNEELMQKSVD